MLTHPQFGRVITAMVTPFDDHMQVDEQEAASLVGYLKSHGSNGVVIAGTTGESATLTTEEKVRLYKIAKEAAGPDMSVIAGTGSYNTDASIALTQAAEKAGADAALVVVPYYNKPTQEGMIQHFKAIASSTNLPIILYNVPGRTVSNILPATVAKLADECPNIVGIKEATGNLAQVGELAAIVPATFAIYSGDDFVTLPMLSVGGCGVISVSSHVIGPMISQMHEAFFSKDLDTARALHLKSLSITKALFCTTSPSPVKYAMAKLGIISNSSLRLPMVEPEENEKKLIETALSWIL